MRYPMVVKSLQIVTRNSNEWQKHLRETYRTHIHTQAVVSHSHRI